MKRTGVFVLLVLGGIGWVMCTDTISHSAKRGERATKAGWNQEMQRFQLETQGELEAVDQKLKLIEGLGGVNAAPALRDEVRALRIRQTKVEQDLKQLSTAKASTYLHRRVIIEQRLNDLATDIESIRLQLITERGALLHEIRDHARALRKSIEQIDRRVQQMDARTEGGHTRIVAGLHQRQKALSKQIRRAESLSDQAFARQREPLIKTVTELRFKVREAGDYLDRMAQVSGESFPFGRTEENESSTYRTGTATPAPRQEPSSL